MLGQHFASTAADNRIFVYEVSGLHENEVTQYQSNPIRHSHSQFIQVPFNRMSEMMQRITMMQGKIVNIFPLENQAAVLRASESSGSAPEDSTDELEASDTDTSNTEE